MGERRVGVGGVETAPIAVCFSRCFWRTGVVDVCSKGRRVFVAAVGRIDVASPVEI